MQNYGGLLIVARQSMVNDLYLKVPSQGKGKAYTTGLAAP